MLSFFLSYLLIYKYTILFFVVLTASFGLPLPATALLMAAGAFVEQGYFDVGSIFLCGILASVSGDITGYFLSFRYGREVLSRMGLRKIIQSKKFLTIEKTFAKHSASTIFLSRFLATSLGPTVNILAGISKTSYKKFLFYDILGEILYIGVFTGLGYVFANQWENISDISQNAMIVVVLILALVAIFLRVFRKKK